MKIIIPFLAVVLLVLFVVVGVSAHPYRLYMQYLFGIGIPYAALAIFAGGFLYRVVKWGKSPVPFRIPTTCGQQESLPWIKQNRVENPSTMLGVIVRMALEVLLFRSLFRNLKAEIHSGSSAYGSDKWLWLGGLAFHWSFLAIVTRHLRFFLQNVPWPLALLEQLDSFLQIGLPLLYMTDVLILGAVTFLFIRRVVVPQVRYISLPADYFPLFLIFGIVISGMLMRYVLRVHVVGVKELAMGLVSLSPGIPEGGLTTTFYVHIFLISTLFAYIPFSKLMHMGGVFLSPTRNLANNNRKVMHVNPWNPDVVVHTYEEYEDEFREKMKSFNIPVEKE